VKDGEIEDEVGGIGIEAKFLKSRFRDRGWTGRCEVGPVLDKGTPDNN
jgi:hypothetical protein